jgi:hypothetical protein
MSIQEIKFYAKYQKNYRFVQLNTYRFHCFESFNQYFTTSSKVGTDAQNSVQNQQAIELQQVESNNNLVFPS